MAVVVENNAVFILGVEIKAPDFGMILFGDLGGKQYTLLCGSWPKLPYTPQTAIASPEPETR